MENNAHLAVYFGSKASVPTVVIQPRRSDGTFLSPSDSSLNKAVTTHTFVKGFIRKGRLA
jgi:hypothetical protein